MGELSGRSQAQIKTGENGPRWEVSIGAIELSDPDGFSRLKNASVAYDAASGTSEASITTDLAMADLIGAPVRVSLGYGDATASATASATAPATATYFDGNLGPVEDDFWGLEHTGTAYGPFKLMAGQIFGEQVDYRGWSIGDFFLDLHKRAGYRADSITVQGGRNFTLQGTDVIFPLETYLADAARSVADSAGFVFTDLPDNRRLVMEAPRIGATGRTKAVYDPGTYPVGGFTARSETRRQYGSVVVFRRGEGGAMDFEPVAVPVHTEGRYKPKRLRAYVIPEFVGDVRDAEKEANRMARLLEMGLYSCELTGIGANPDVKPFDTVETEAVEWYDRGGRAPEPYETLYRWIVGGQISATIDENGMLMGLSGEGVRVYSRPMRRERFVTDRRRSPYVVTG